MILSDKIMCLRKRNGWSQEELAHKINVSRQSVSKWENESAVPEMDKIVLLSNIFNVSTDYLLKEDMKEDCIDTGRIVLPESKVVILNNQDVEFMRNRTSGKATASMIIGIVSLVFAIIPGIFYIAPVLALIGLVLGIIAKKEIATKNLTNGGSANAGIVLSIIAFVITGFMFVLVSFTVG